MPFRGDIEGSVGLLAGHPSVRPAEPEDSTFLADVILMASRSHLPRGLWDLVIDSEAEDRLVFLEVLTLIDAPSFCNYENFVVVTVDDQPVAALAGFDANRPGFLSPGQLIAEGFNELGWSGAELSSAFERLGAYQTAVPEPAKGLWTIEWVATLPSFRRQGFVRRLLERTLADGRDRGLRRAQVTTFLDNVAARQAYLRQGFTLAEERRHADFERLVGSPGLVRFERELA